MARLKDHPDGGRIRLLLLGDGARKPALQALAHQLGLTNVCFVETVPKDQVVRYWSLLDVSVIHLRHTELFTTVIPSKLFECMGMGIPVLHGVAGESAVIVERESVGVAFAPEDVDGLVQGLLRLKRDPALRRLLAERGPLAAHRYDRRTLGSRMLDTLRSAAALASNVSP